MNSVQLDAFRLSILNTCKGGIPLWNAVNTHVQSYNKDCISEQIVGFSIVPEKWNYSMRVNFDMQLRGLKDIQKYGFLIDKEYIEGRVAKESRWANIELE